MFPFHGIFQGFGVVLKNFWASFFLNRDSGGIATIQYPEEKPAIKEHFRNFPFLVYDEKPENPRCVACDICAKECPPKCIFIVRETDKDGKPLKKPAVFDIDFSICMNCGICEEVCPFDAVFMDHEFEISTHERFQNLLYKKENLLKPNSYFHQIRPTDAKAVDDHRHKATPQPPEASS